MAVGHSRKAVAHHNLAAERRRLADNYKLPVADNLVEAHKLPGPDSQRHTHLGEVDIPAAGSQHLEPLCLPWRPRAAQLST